ncbi:MAG: hypothetical protein WA804_01020 [Terriglobales bacterium]
MNRPVGPIKNAGLGLLDHGGDVGQIWIFRGKEKHFDVLWA